MTQVTTDASKYSQQQPCPVAAILQYFPSSSIVTPASEGKAHLDLLLCLDKNGGRLKHLKIDRSSKGLWLLGRRCKNFHACHCQWRERQRERERETQKRCFTGPRDLFAAMFPSEHLAWSGEDSCQPTFSYRFGANGAACRH